VGIEVAYIQVNGTQQQLVSWVSVPAKDTDGVCLYAGCADNTHFFYIKISMEFHKILVLYIFLAHPALVQVIFLVVIQGAWKYSRSNP